MNQIGALKVEPVGDTDILMTREFNAPRSFVFDAWTKPELLKRWLGGFHGWSLTVCEVDLRVSGHYRYVMEKDDGASMGWGGEFREVIAPSRLVYTEDFDEAWYEGDAVNFMDLTEAGGRTTMLVTTRYDTRETRDAVLSSGAYSGAEVSFARLDHLIATDAA